MSRLVWFDDGESILPEFHVGSPFIQKLIIIGTWVAAVVDYPAAMSLSRLIIPPRDKTQTINEQSTQRSEPLRAALLPA